jgi:hypothetical protein
MKSVILALSSILILSSCATQGKMTGLHEGMTKAEVVKVAGDPDGYQREGEYEVLLYIDRNSAFRSAFGTSYRDAIDYSVILKDGQVVEYGPGRTHQRGSAETPFVRVPGR